MPNKILEAFIQGTTQKRQRESDAEDKKFRADQAKVQQDQFKQQLDLTTKQHEIENARLETIAKFNQAALELKQQQELSEQFSKTGISPTGFEESNASSVPIKEGVAGTSHEFSASDKTSPFKGFRGVDPETAALQEARRTEITQQPAIEKQLEILTKQNENAIALKKIEETAKAKADRDKAESDYRRAIDVAKIRASATRANKDVDEDKLLSPDEAEKFQVAYGTKRKDVFGKQAGIKLTPAQSDKITKLDALEKKVLDAQALIDTEEGQKFFMGPASGLLAEGSRAVSNKRDQKFEKIRSTLGGLEGDIVKERAGTSFTPNEQKLLETYLTKPAHTSSYDTAKPQMEALLKTIRDLRGETLANISDRVIMSPKIKDYDSLADELLKSNGTK